MRARIFLMVIVLLLVFEGLACAHSTAGRMRTTLDKVDPQIDDVAFYIESWVSKRVDETGKAGRFWVFDFTGIKNMGDTLTVRMQIFDQKTSQKAREELILKRGKGNTWNHVDAQGDVITSGIFTYVKPGPPVWMLIAGAFLIACLVQLVIMFWRACKRKCMAKTS